jgi:hypothetical protein
MEESINLLDIKKGFPGITAQLCGTYYEACMVCLHISEHHESVNLALKGDLNQTVTLLWKDYYNEQVERSWKEENTTEYGAICISVMLVKKYTELYNHREIKIWRWR